MSMRSLKERIDEHIRRMVNFREKKKQGLDIDDSEFYKHFQSYRGYPSMACNENRVTYQVNTPSQV